jgi:YesN/AraC family two-component response regulator
VNGQEAWEVLQGEDLPDLIISDLMMPVMDGLQLLERVKGSDRLCHLPVIMLTARADVQVRLRALRIGVDDYLTKPFVEEELMVRVSRLLENYRQRSEWQESAAEDPELGELEVESPARAGVHDMEWLAQVEAVYMEYLADANLGIAQVASKVHLGERQFLRRLKRLTGLTPNLYLREIRLQKARDYLQQQRFATVKETAAAVGFTKTQYFSSLFQERFGVPPSHYFS